MDYSDHSEDGENYHIRDIFGNGLDIGYKGKISPYDSPRFLARAIW